MPDGTAGGAPWWDDLDADRRREQRRHDDLAVGELVPAEWAGATIAGRLASARGRVLTVALASTTLVGTVEEVTGSWFTLRTAGGRALVMTASVVTMSGVPATASSPEPPATRRLSSVCRQWLRERRRVQLTTSQGTAVVGSVVRVGRDHLDLVEHPQDRQAVVTDRILTLPYAGLAWCLARD